MLFSAVFSFVRKINIMLFLSYSYFHSQFMIVEQAFDRFCLFLAVKSCVSSCIIQTRLLHYYELVKLWLSVCSLFLVFQMAIAKSKQGGWPHQFSWS